MNDYELIDFGDGRRLERFGSLILDRLCPVAEGLRPKSPGAWKRADARFTAREKSKTSDRGDWTASTSRGEEYFGNGKLEPWTVSLGLFQIELRGTPFGHVGVFPEQQPNWEFIARQIGEAAKNRTETIRVLNLFAYTGGSSLAAATAGPNVEVVHVDSSKSAVDRARRNGEWNGLRIRCIVEDVRKFIRRELKRNNRYDVVILDPPGYGHGVKGEAWKLADDLPPLLEDLARLLSEKPVLLLLTAHTPPFDGPRLREMLGDVPWPKKFRDETFAMDIPATTGASLPSGCACRLIF